VLQIVLLLSQLIALLKIALFVVAAVLFVVFLIDWLARTRRMNPFHPVARFVRRSVDPFIMPIEQRVVRSGGLPANAPWWALAVVVVGGILLIVLLQQVQVWLVQASSASRAGATGILALTVSWAIGILQIALLVRVIASWVRTSEFAWWVRWAVVLTDPIIRPLSRVIPPMGMMDITPLVAYFALWILKRILLSAIL
jgi:YggT family protein